MKITKTQLRDWGACVDGYEWFLRRFAEEEAAYQAVLDALVEDGRLRDADWLMDHAGADPTAVLEVESIDATHLFFAGRIVVARGVKLTGTLRAGRGIKAGEDIKAGWDIQAGDCIQAGWSIEAGWGVKAGEDIKAGWDIQAGDCIQAGWSIEAGDCIQTGEGWACFAGLHLPVNQWPMYAKVIARKKPTNLVGGFWVELQDKEE